MTKNEAITYTPIGFELLDHRVSKLAVHQRSGKEYHNQVKKNTDRIKYALDRADKQNSRGYHCTASIDLKEGNESKSNEVKKIGRPVNKETKRKRKRVCCASWCNKVLTEGMKSVPSLGQRPVPIDQKVPSEKQIVKFKGVFGFLFQA